jgi:DNA polymerase-3 subunit epsilon
MLNHKDILYFDIETTGLSVWRDKIVEIGMIYNDKSKVIKINPGIQISDGASRVHGITNEVVKHSPYFGDVAPQIFELFNKCRGVCGYNIRNYDLPLLQFELLRCDKDYILPDFQIIDVYEISQSLFKSLKLKDLYLVLSGKPLNNAHSAIADIEATKELLEIINERYLSGR